jgi:SAM-dependent methyltransferase
VSQDHGGKWAVEEERLKHSWERHEARFLDHYMTGGIEDPRVNLSSILVRGLIADTLFPGQFDALVQEEARFSLFFTWYLKELEKGVDMATLETNLRLESQLPPEIEAIVRYIRRESSGIPDYTIFQSQQEEGRWEPIPHTILDSFVELWRIALDGQSVEEKPRLLEAACGSANDYRILAATGLDRFMDYTGFDIAPTNIGNARRRFPQAHFQVATSFVIPLADNAIDYTYTFDLLEHLSLDGMERSLEELLRVTRREVWLGFFNLGRGPDHVEKPVDFYHCNEISETALVKWLNDRGHECAVLRLPEWQEEKFGVPGYYNQEAAIVLVQP